MKSGKKKDHAYGTWFRENIFAIVLFAAIAVMMVAALRDASGASNAEQLRIAEESVRRAVVSCYAMEGRYPDSYEYLKENYGVCVDEQKFVVRYEVFGSNIMPEITILEVDP